MGKLATRRSRKRIVRKLPPAVVVVKSKPSGWIHRVRHALNLNKSLAYTILLGAVLGAYIYDSDESRLQSIMAGTQQTVEEARSFYFGA